MPRPVSEMPEEPSQRISRATRRDIIDHLIVMDRRYYGRMDLVDFLGRTWDLSTIRSSDYRFETAEGDIRQHMVNNHDWDHSYLLNKYLRLPEADDQTFLRFLESCVHPIIARNMDEQAELVDELNSYLEQEGYQLEVRSYIAEKPVYRAEVVEQDEAEVEDEAQPTRVEPSSVDLGSTSTPHPSKAGIPPQVPAPQPGRGGPSTTEAHPEADIAIITALPTELDAVLRHIGAHTYARQYQVGTRTYYHCINQAGLSVVAASALGMGQVNAALLAADLMRDWKVKKLLLVGIAAGIKGKVAFGDVVVSEQMVDYELARVTTGEDPATRWSVYRGDARLLDRVMNYRDLSWAEAIRVQRPVADGKTPTVNIGVVMSGNKVIADDATAGSLISVWNRALAIEMESAAVAAAVYQAQSPPAFLMIKAVCDFADRQKNDIWQPYAADVAGAYTASLVLNALGPAEAIITPAPATSRVKVGNVDYRGLRFILEDLYDLQGLRVLTFDLGEKWDNIRGQTLTEKAVELIEHMERRGKLDDLIGLVKHDRPGLVERYG